MSHTVSLNISNRFGKCLMWEFFFFFLLLIAKPHNQQCAILYVTTWTDVKCVCIYVCAVVDWLTGSNVLSKRKKKAIRSKKLQLGPSHNSTKNFLIWYLFSRDKRNGDREKKWESSAEQKESKTVSDFISIATTIGFILPSLKKIIANHSKA